MRLLVRSFLSVGTKMFLEIAQSREEFGAATAIESFAVVETQMGP